MAEQKNDVPRVLLAAADAAGREALRVTREVLESFGIACSEAESVGTADLAGVRAVIVASADAGLPGEFAAATERPVVRVPVAGDGRVGVTLLHNPATNDLLAADAPFATVAIGEAGAKNAALFVVSVLALDDPRLRAEWAAFRQRQTDAVLAAPPLAVR